MWDGVGLCCCCCCCFVLEVGVRFGDLDCLGVLPLRLGADEVEAMGRYRTVVDESVNSLSG